MFVKEPKCKPDSCSYHGSNIQTPDRICPAPFNPVVSLKGLRSSEWPFERGRAKGKAKRFLSCSHHSESFLPSLCKRRERRIYDREKAAAFSRLKINDLSVSIWPKRKGGWRRKEDLPKTFPIFQTVKNFRLWDRWGKQNPFRNPLLQLAFLAESPGFGQNNN